ncbi:ribosomal protein L22 [Xylariaceae sp. FL0016]|nr:ribosomal protein L22 [Xylariaceae sp. FL0016]
MSLHLPAKRAAQYARITLTEPSLHLQYLQPKTQRRNAWFDGFFGKKPNLDKSPLAKELTKREREKKMGDRMLNRTSGESIFDKDIKQSQKKLGDASSPTTAGTSMAFSPMKEHMQRALDPDPRWRIRYQKRKVMQMVKKNGQLTQKERLKMSEKELTSASDPLPTSVKKLVKLSHQIVGKTVEEAIVQMRFSKKKMAREVKFQLEEARNSAIVARGMGLGAHGGQIFASPKKIQTKEGKWIEVSDPTQLYVDQSWVGKRQARGARINFHGRGRMSMMRRPTTSISIVLKEEKTRIRQHHERVEKEAKKAPWIHLPNRPVTAQRKYYCW